jgi:hypothetical protein
MGLRDPKHPVRDGYWKVRGSATSAVAAGFLFGEVEGATVLQISKLEWADRAAVDWQKLDAVYTQAIQRPAAVPQEKEPARPLTLSRRPAYSMQSALESRE